MNPQFRTVALIAAALGLLVSLFFALRPSDDDEAAGTTTSAATAVPTLPPVTTSSADTTPTPVDPTATPTPAPPEVVTIRVTVTNESAGTVRDFSVKRGRDVELIVTSEIADHVHVHGYDLMADVAPGSPATIRFTADTPGLFEIELEDHGIQIAELEVRP